jgi:hypothetical protein
LDEQPGAALVAILSHRLWTRRFAADAAVLGRLVARRVGMTQPQTAR